MDFDTTNLSTVYTALLYAASYTYCAGHCHYSFWDNRCTRQYIDEPALNPISKMKTKVSDAMLKPKVLQLMNVLNQLYPI